MDSDSSSFPTSIAWMLQSTQVSDADLAKILGQEYQENLTVLGLYLTSDPSQALQAARDTLAWAIANRRLYWGETSVRLWLFDRMISGPGQDGFWARAAARLGKPPASIQEEAGTVLKPLNPKARLAIFLFYRCELQPEEIASILKVNASSILPMLVKARQKLKTNREWNPSRVDAAPTHPEFAQRLELEVEGLLTPEEKMEVPYHLETCSGCREYHDQLVRQEKQFHEKLYALWPTPELSEEQLATFVLEVDAQSAHLWGGQHARLRWRELALAGAVVALLGIVVWTNNLLSISPAATAPVVIREITVEVTPPTSSLGVFFMATGFPDQLSLPPTQVPASTQLPPLNALSSLTEVLTRLRQSSRLWSTLWGNAVIYDYGPSSYVGPAQVYQNRVWISQPHEVLVLSGSLEQPDYTRIVVGPNQYEMDLRSGISYYPRSLDFLQGVQTSSLLQSYVESFDRRNWLYGYYLDNLTSPIDPSLYPGSLVIVGEETFVNRKAMILARYINRQMVEQIWVDAQTGILLGIRTYDSSNPALVSREIFFTDLSFNLDFPAGLYTFRPTINKTTWTSVWTPEAPPLTPNAPPSHRIPVSVAAAPKGFDASQLPLTFQWSTDPSGNGPGDWAELQAGGYSLGSANLGDPWGLLCARSPDGRFLALIDQPDVPFYNSKRLFWLDLSDAATIHEPLPNGSTGSSLAFSPDSQTLAFFGCGGVDTNCGVYLHNIRSLKNVKLIGLELAGYFNWSPDGKQLALIGAEGASNLHVIVLDVQTGDTLYSGPVDWQRMQAAADSPTAIWGTNFPTPMGGLDACTHLPVNR